MRETKSDITLTHIEEDNKKLTADRFWLFWGLAPPGTPKHEAGLKALEFAHRETKLLYLSTLERKVEELGTTGLLGEEEIPDDEESNPLTSMK